MIEPTVKSSLTPKARTVGRYVLKLLETNKGGKVHSVFRHAVNILTDEEKLLVLLEFEEAPWNITLGTMDFIQSGIQPGSRVVMSKEEVAIDSRLFVSLRGAKIWSDSNNNSRSSPDTIERSIFQVISVLRTAKMWGGLGSLLVENRSLGPGTIDFAEYARPRIDALLEAVICGRPDRVEECASRLAGLGIGSTPSCDDFLVGFMLALRSFASTSNKEYADRVCRAILAGSRNNTTIISQNLIEYSCLGMASRTMSEFLHSFADCDKSLTAKTLDVMRHGATSGEDTLVGIIEGAATSQVL
jgi:hypothetical protein